MTGTSGSVEFRAADPTIDPAATLLVEMTHELNSLYETPHRLDHPLLSPDELVPPRGIYLVGWRNEQAVAGGGLRPLDDGSAEIKRMYVRPKFRRQGLAALLLQALEDHASSLGYPVVRLDTGPLQAEAKRLYERQGFRSIAPYNDNPYATFFGEKALSQ
jgi:GNAT superfamily N-acetyltransferase